MAQKPTLPVMQLDLQKTTTYVAKPFRMTEGDKGYQQPFRLSNAWAEYDVEPETLAFSATKADGQVVEVSQEPDRFHLIDGVWFFDLPDEITQAIGNVSAYFYVQDDDNNILASTTKFGYEVSAHYGDDIASNSYVSAFERLEKQFQEYLENCRNELNNFNDLNNDAKAKLTDLLDKLQQQTGKWLQDKEKAVDDDIKQRTDKLDELTTQYNTTYNEQVNKFNQKYTDLTQQFTQQAEKINQDASDQRDKIDADYKTKLQAALDDVVKQRDSAIEQINAKWADQSKKLDETFNEQLTQLTKTWTDKQASMDSALADLEKTADELTANFSRLNGTDLPNAQATMNQLKQSIKDAEAKFDSVDFSKFVTGQQFSDYQTTVTNSLNAKANAADVYAKADTMSKTEIQQAIDNGGKVKTVDGIAPDTSGNVATGRYTNQEIDDKLAQAGKLKTISLNGGAKIEPDSEGNADLTVPQPDLSAYATKTDLQTVSATATQAASDASSAKSAADTAQTKVNSLQTEVDVLKSTALTAKTFSTLAQAQAYAKEHPTVMCVVSSG
jgi:hypothetical protein